MLSPGQFPLQATPGPSPDASDPLMAMMFQAMGMPILPVPPNASLAQSASPIGRSQQNASALNGTGKTRINARCRDYDTKGFCVRGDTCPFEHGNDHMVAPGQDVVEYDPKNSALTDIPAISPQGSSFAGHSMKSWSNDAVQSSYRGRGGTQDRGGSTRRQNRADFSQVGPNHDHSRTAIVVEQIPEDKFDEQSVRDFFSTYGAIATIDMRPYKHLAIVTYDDYWSAKQAYESPKVIFDNRFVKVYWYNPDSVPPSRSTTKHLSGTATSLIMQKTEEPEYKKEEFERSAMAAQKKLEEKKVLMKEAEAKRLALEKQKEELAQKQAEEKKKLLEKLAAKGAASNGAVNGEGRQTNGTVHTDDQASAQTKALRAQVSALEAEAKSLGLDTSLSEDPWPVRGRGRGRARGRGSYRGWEGFAGHGD
ncbi:MAG: hypothetical protein L6R37_008453, partial [Teloschistes peruensis]